MKKQLSQARWEQVRGLFARVADLAPHLRAEILSEACAADGELRAEVESLLEQDSHVTEGFLSPPDPPTAAREPLPPAAPELPPGSKVGRYEIKRVIASGGMGTVYLAVQDEPHREVALKVMRRNVASPSALRRFQLESHVLGYLRHPNVAQVYEAGMHGTGSTGISSAGPPSPAEGGNPLDAVGLGGPTLQTATASPGVPYFAMEYVPDAKTITRYADDAALGLRDRLAMFAKVCDAVHHGHQKGVIHRDLKPGNILVDSTAEPKVIDFGVARATDSDLAITTMQTDVGQLIGTLQYMSPEQCDAGMTDIDTRSDVYSLGVVLYELLCGKPPYDVSDTTIVRAARIITEQNPSPPSALNSKLRGDAETLLLKALAKDRERRYQSAAELAADIRRFLNREPIAARTPTAWRRMTHLIARHPIATTTVASVTIAVLTLSAAFAIAIWVNSRPYDLLLRKRPGLENYSPGFQVQLKTISGNVLKAWPRLEPTDANSGVGIAALIQRPAELGGGRIAVIGYNNSVVDPLAGALWAIYVDGDLDEPLWIRRVENEDVLPALREHRGFTGADFTFKNGIIADVFPDRAGSEIVAVFSHHRYSPRIVRIYDLAGDLLYQVWHDGSAESFQWVPGAGLIVLAGDYHKPFWTSGGELKALRTRVRVVFALRPKAGFIGTEFLDPGADGAASDPLSPAWFNVLEPLDSADHALRLWVSALNSLRGFPSRVDVSVSFGDERLGVSWVLDDLGQTLPGWPLPTDGFRQNQKLPSADPNKLDLPSWRELRFVPFDEKKHTQISAACPLRNGVSRLLRRPRGATLPAAER